MFDLRVRMLTLIGDRMTISRNNNYPLSFYMKPSLSDFQQWYNSHEKEIFSDYFTFLRFPSISTDPEYKPEILKTASWLESYLKKLGMEVEIWETPGNPVIYATHLQAGVEGPTVLIYQHYDIQPVDPLEKWHSNPFEPEIRDGKVYARGASDNKGQCFYSVTALKAFLELCKTARLNIKLFIEGEEECGSVGSTAILAQKKEALQADHLLIVDMGLANLESPVMTLGLRGIAALEVICQNSAVDLHSGMLGGIALNPNRLLIQILATLWDADGKVAVPGFYDEVTTPTSEELQLFDQTLDPEVFRKTFGVQAFQGEGGYSLWESNTIRPTLEINGIGGGYTGAGFKTVIPSCARAKISCRLAPEQNPEKISERIASYLQKQAPEGVTLQVEWNHGGKPVRSSPTSRIATVAAQALEEIFGKACQRVLCGASVPIVADLREASGADVVMIGVSLPEDDIHAPNEHFKLEQFEKGFLMITRILSILSEG